MLHMTEHGWTLVAGVKGEGGSERSIEAVTGDFSESPPAWLTQIAGIWANAVVDTKDRDDIDAVAAAVGVDTGKVRTKRAALRKLQSFDDTGSLTKPKRTSPTRTGRPSSSASSPGAGGGSSSE